MAVARAAAASTGIPLYRRLVDRVPSRMSVPMVAALSELRAALDGSVNARTRWTWRAAFPLAQDTARRAVHAELTTVEGHATWAYQDGMARFVRLANDFLGRLAATEPLLAQLPPLEPPVELPAKGHFYFTDLMTLTASSPWGVLMDWLGSRAYQNQRIAERTSAYLARLLETNTSRVVNDLHERLVESRRELESELRARLTELVMSAQRAAQRARDIGASGESAIRPELARLASLRQRVERMVSEEDTPHPRRDSMA